MKTNIYELKLIGHGQVISKTSVENLLEDLVKVIKPHRDDIEINYCEDTVDIKIVSATKFKKNVHVGHAVGEAVQFKHHGSFSRMYKVINGVDVGISIFHDMTTVVQSVQGRDKSTDKQIHNQRHMNPQQRHNQYAHHYNQQRITKANEMRQHQEPINVMLQACIPQQPVMAQPDMQPISIINKEQK